jgi:hypothetical protein
MSPRLSLKLSLSTAPNPFLPVAPAAFGRNPERSGSFPNPTCLQLIETPEIPGLGWIAIVR